MRAAIMCEESQAVTIEMRRVGVEAYSFDILPCSGGHPEWHVQGDALSHLNDRWDIIIAFPPCTYLTNAGTRHFSERLNPPDKIALRKRLRQQAADFFMAFVECDCEQVCIENPVGWMNTQYRKPDQIIHPYYFGDPYKKRTCLWLRGLPKLVHTNMLPEPEPLYICQGEKSGGKKIGWCEGITVGKGGQAARAIARSKTFPGIARAMAEQWGTL